MGQTWDTIYSENAQLRFSEENWSGRRDSNPQPSAWEADALPLRHTRSG